MENITADRRSEPRTGVDKYYSVEFSVGESAYLYQFKIWDMSSKGMCLLVKEDSEVLGHLKVGDVVTMKYYKADATATGEYVKTEIRHITKDDQGRFRGHCMVGLFILEDSN